MSSTPVSTTSSNSNNGGNIITALGNAFKTPNGEPVPGDRIAQLLLQNMNQLSELAKQGKLNSSQIKQLKEYADKHKAPTTPVPVPVPVPVPPPVTSNAALKTMHPTPFLNSTATNDTTYPISSTPTITNPGPVPWPSVTAGRPTLTGGIPGGRISGTPAMIAKPTEDASLLLDDSRSRRKTTAADQSMRRSIQDLVSSIDPNVKIEPEVEDLLLDIADEFIDSVTNFGCRLAKHRGGDTLEVKDLQLHLERNHNIRIPGFASDETRISLSQTAPAPAPPTAPSTKKGAQNINMTLRSHRLAQVQLAKKESKLM